MAQTRTAAAVVVDGTTILPAGNGDITNPVDEGVRKLTLANLLTWINKNVTESFIIAVGDESTAIVAGVAKVTFRMPYPFTLTEVRTNLKTASSSGLPDVDVKEAGASIFSVRPTIDVGEKTSVTAVTAAVISDANLADDAEMTIDIVTAGTGAVGLKVILIGHKT